MFCQKRIILIFIVTGTVIVLLLMSIFLAKQNQSARLMEMGIVKFENENDNDELLPLLLIATLIGLADCCRHHLKK